MGRTSDILRFVNSARSFLFWQRSKSIASAWFLTPYLTQEQRQPIVLSGDPVRYGTIRLAFEQIARDNITGAIAECGVFKGQLSTFLHQTAPDRSLYLFDTFEGFDSRDSDTAGDSRFRDTSEESVLRRIGDTRNVIVRKGYFPESAAGMDKERFAFIMIDFDKYDPTCSALQFFYPLVNKGGFVFVHDYTSPESNWACSRALNEFLKDKPEQPMLIPDAWGSAFFRKI